MCEHYIARAAEPFRLDELWPFTSRVERFGLAGYGWGAGWLTNDGRLEMYRDVHAFNDDAGREMVGATETTSAIVHLRRPSKLSTLTIADTQPFADPDGRFVFSHNGDLRDHKAWRPRFAAQGRLKGRADTEVGQRWLEDEWDRSRPADLLCRLHETFGGQANLALLAADGTPHAYAGNSENPMFTFRLGRIGIASTGIYSIDRSLFRYAAAGATSRRVVKGSHTVALDPDGRAVLEG
ncbi:MAG: class II glutamine amidotransferase [Chloroflexota bacterium]